MKTTGTIATEKKTASKIDLFEDKKVDPATKSRIQQEVGEYLVEQINEYLTRVDTPVAGVKYEKKLLSKDYKRFKEAEGFRGVPDLELTGEMKDQLGFKKTSEGIELGVFGSSAEKADGHNNFSGKSQLPPRQFLPKAGENFVNPVKKQVEAIVAEALMQESVPDADTLREIENKNQFTIFVKDFYQGLTLSQVRDTVLGSQELVRLFGAFNLLRFL